MLSKVSEEFLTDEGYFNFTRYPDCNLFDPRSIAAAAGFKDASYFLKRGVDALSVSAPCTHHSDDRRPLRAPSRDRRTERR